MPQPAFASAYLDPPEVFRKSLDKHANWPKQRPPAPSLQADRRPRLSLSHAEPDGAGLRLNTIYYIKNIESGQPAVRFGQLKARP